MSPLSSFALGIMTGTGIIVCTMSFGIVLAVRLHLPKSFDLLFRCCLPQPVDVEKARNPIAVMVMAAYAILTLQSQGRR